MIPVAEKRVSAWILSGIPHPPYISRFLFSAVSVGAEKNRRISNYHKITKRNLVAELLCRSGNAPAHHSATKHPKRRRTFNMFEITYNDSDTLQNFIDADKAYHGAVYDFTFEGRFIVYHFFVKDTARYVALDSMTGYGSEITRRRKSNLFDHRSYHSMTPMVLASIKYTGDKRYLNVMVSNPLEAIESIFRTILPEYGFAVREAQIKLSQDMYLGLTGKQVAICEAEVGAGKTLAYLIASFVAKNRYAAEHGFSLPVTISTSSIELQKMIVEKEVPQLSRMLQDYGLIKHPLCAVVRKGKEHYFCKARYYDYLNKIMTHKEKYQNLLDYFTANNIAVRAFDLDLWDMPAAIKGKVCVKGGCSHCESTLRITSMVAP